MNPRYLATRKSRLALWQSEHVRDRLVEAHPDLAVELMPMSTRGDEVLDRSLAEIGGKGLFLKELEHAIVEGRADFAVHSLKDVPARMPDGLVLAAWLPRADAGDLWITRDATPIERMPPGSRVGSSSLRRIRQLEALRSDLEIVPLRGNVETRMNAVFEGRIDATVLAAAGLRRLGVEPATAIELSTDRWLPAPGQGVIAIECRADDVELRARLAAVSCEATRTAVAAERAVVDRLGADCRMPLAAHAELDGERLRLRARLGGERGVGVEVELEGPAGRADALGRRAAERLLAEGGEAILVGLKS
ncbi:hydroxymethylbilane synthase [Wenzhouxiangella sp. XN79A]|uniref:hydroxymethylbilane synthase n=1 Tax=Wenzhouxiangella sp. XN79A TaxID=2724193 RepID=UPI00144ABC71|nr:hydroxymethylbilane synthase [Wenzhouxiangella sp. XN79A]NKI35797.1 hydroxymethylbilane synthase [Wenzhouxiangella sp. XN79A]